MQLSKGQYVAITSATYTGPGKVIRVLKTCAALRGLILEYSIDQVVFVKCGGDQRVFRVFLHNEVRGWINEHREHVIINACEIGRGAS